MAPARCVLALLAIGIAIAGGCSSRPASGPDSAWTPEPVWAAPPSLVEVRPLREEPVLGVHVAPGRILIMAPRAWDAPVQVRAVQSGVTGTVVGVADWWSGMRISWALLDVHWNGEAPGIAALARINLDVGQPLRIVSVRNSNITTIESTMVDTGCSVGCLHATSDQPFVGHLRRGAPAHDDRGRVVALFGGFGVGTVRPSGTLTEIVDLISADEWRRCAPRRQAGEEGFVAALLAEEAAAKAVRGAVDLYRGGSFEDVIAQCTVAVEADPENGAAWQLIGVSLYNMDRLAEAAEALRSAIGRSPTPLTAKALLASCAARLGDNEEASSLAMEVAVADEANAQSLKWAASTLMNTERYEDAVKAAGRVLEFEPNDEWTQRLLKAAEEMARPSFGRIQIRRSLSPPLDWVDQSASGG